MLMFLLLMLLLYNASGRLGQILG